MAETFNRASVALTSTAITDVYQAPTSAGARAIVLSCMVANVNGTAGADITLQLASSANVNIAKLANTIAVPADATLEAVQNKVVLLAGEKLRATAGTANYLELTVSVLEIT